MFIYQKIRTLMDETQANNKSVRIQDMADEIGISKKSLENYRDGASQPTVEVLERVAVYFGKDLNYFFDNEIVNKQPKGEEQKKNGVVKSPVTIYEPETELAKCYKIMFEQQKEIADQQKEMTELVREIEKLKKPNAPDNIANVG